MGDMPQESSGAKNVESLESQLPKRRRVVIETDGAAVVITLIEVTNLELAEIGRRLIQLAGGSI